MGGGVEPAGAPRGHARPDLKLSMPNRDLTTTSTTAGARTAPGRSVSLPVRNYSGHAIGVPGRYIESRFAVWGGLLNLHSRWSRCSNHVLGFLSAEACTPHGFATRLVKTSAQTRLQNHHGQSRRLELRLLGRLGSSRQANNRRRTNYKEQSSRKQEPGDLAGVIRRGRAPGRPFSQGPQPGLSGCPSCWSGRSGSGRTRQ